MAGPWSLQPEERAGPGQEAAPREAGSASRGAAAQVTGRVIPLPLRYERDPALIYAKSFATVRAEARLDRFPPGMQALVTRVIHACGMVEVADRIAFSPGAWEAGRAALAAGADIHCDCEMVAAGIQRARLASASTVRVTLNDPAVAGHARSIGNTRSAAAVEFWRDRLAGSVVAIGNAPTALFHLLELLDQGWPRPALILGFPVGFVGAAESKAALALNPRGVGFVTLRGRRGGSAMASAAVNALAPGEGAGEQAQPEATPDAIPEGGREPRSGGGVSRPDGPAGRSPWTRPPAPESDGRKGGPLVKDAPACPPSPSGGAARDTAGAAAGQAEASGDSQQGPVRRDPADRPQRPDAGQAPAREAREGLAVSAGRGPGSGMRHGQGVASALQPDVTVLPAPDAAPDRQLATAAAHRPLDGAMQAAGAATGRGALAPSYPAGGAAVPASPGKDGRDRAQPSAPQAGDRATEGREDRPPTSPAGDHPPSPARLQGAGVPATPAAGEATAPARPAAPGGAAAPVALPGRCRP